MKKLSILSVLSVFAILLLLPLLCTAESVTYKEAPSLASRVSAGELPPVEQRLPKNPNVLNVDEVGKYGGLWRQAVIPASFTHAFHHATGYLGNGNALIYDRDNKTITTGWLESYEHNDKYTEFTFKLRDGLKWSDGIPVTTDDVSFWFNDILKNKELTPTESYYTDCTLTVTDSLTWKFSFETSHPLYPAKWAYGNPEEGGSPFVCPSHYLKQFHASHISPEEMKATLTKEGYGDWVLMFREKYDDLKNKDLPVLGPWIMTTDPKTTNSIRFVRNPYYWAVDQTGQQLPYIDECLITIVESPDEANAKVLSGEVDIQVATLQETFSNFLIFSQHADENEYQVLTSEFNEPNAMNFHFNATTVDPVKAPYLSSPEFRKAMSIGINRPAIISAFFRVGPFTSQVAQTSFLADSPYYDAFWSTAYTQFDPGEANRMLDGLGMTQYDADGFRMTAKGEPLSLVILCPNYDASWIKIADMVAAQWRDNLKVNVAAGEIDPDSWMERTEANDFDITCITGSNGFQYVSTGSIADWTGCSGYNWGTRFMPGIHIKEGDKAFPATPEMQQLVDLGSKAQTTIDDKERDDAIKGIIQSYKDNLWIIGIGRRLPAINIVSNHFHNIKNLNQDWAFGFCGSSRPDGYWTDKPTA